MYVPSGGITLQVLGFAFQHARSDLCCSRSILTRIIYVLRTSRWDLGVNEMFVLIHEGIPFVVLSHGERSFFQGFDRLVGFIGFSFQDTGVSIVGFLNLANDN